MPYTMNIGLNRNDGSPATQAPDALKAVSKLFDIGRDGFRWRVFQSDTEPTLVLEWSSTPTDWATGRSVRERVLELADTLAQDCIAIAVHVPSWYRADRFPKHTTHDGRHAVGDLIGPKAEAWGPFNPQYFLDIDGQRLA